MLQYMYAKEGESNESNAMDEWWELKYQSIVKDIVYN
jgi:hypothetical protein